MLLGVIVFKFKDAPLVGIDNMGILVFVIPLMSPSIGHVYMAVKEKFGPVFFQQRSEHLESLVGQVASVVQLVGGGMGDKNIEPSFSEKLEP